MTDDLFDTPQAREEFRRLMQDPAAREAFVQLKFDRVQSGARRRYTHVLRLVGSAVWAIQEPYLRVIVDVLSMRAAGGQFTAEELEQRIGVARNEPSVATENAGVAIIPIQGVIIPKADMFSEMSGGTSVESLRAMFHEALASPQVSAIVFDIDSPGGAADRIPEFAAEIRAARGQKPIVAVANTLAASGAYWLASQADELVASKSSRLGSIGVITVHEEFSKKNEAEGVTATVMTAGKFKGEFNEFEPLTDEAAAHMQSTLDSFHSMFINDVAKGRGVGAKTVRSGFGQGRVLMAREAVDEGMADRIDTLDNVVKKLLGRRTQNTDQAATAGADQIIGTISVPVQVVATIAANDAPDPKPEEPDDELERIEKALETTEETQAVPDDDPENAGDAEDANEPAEETSDPADDPEGTEPASPADDPEGDAETDASLRAELEALALTE